MSLNKKLIAMAHHKFDQSNMQTIATALGGSGPNLIHVHFSTSLLSSASLYATHFKHLILRNLQHVSSSVNIKRMMDLSNEKHQHWQFEDPQTWRHGQFTNTIEQLDIKAESLAIRLGYTPDDQATKDKLEECRKLISRIEELKRIVQNVKGSLHPTVPGGMRGMMIRIKGPRRGNRSAKWQKSAGKYSTNSVDYVISEEAKLGIPSKLGIYGLTVRFVYCKKDSLIGEQRVLEGIVDNENFTFASR